MHPIRQILSDAPPMIPVPAELQHQRLEVIFWPLPEAEEARTSMASATIIDQIRALVASSEPVELGEFQLNLTDCKFDRAEANAR
jgi:hypothetical protein